VVIILDNLTTAMTGLQGHPGTGIGLAGRPARQVKIEEICRGAGVQRVRVIDPYDLKAMEEFLKESLALPDPSVMITRAPCVLLEWVTRQEVFEIDQSLCRACGLCLKTGCPALSAGPGEKPIIAQFLCSGCSVCAQICPEEAIREITNNRGKPRSARRGRSEWNKRLRKVTKGYEQTYTFPFPFSFTIVYVNVYENGNDTARSPRAT
jgi:indolepyruvate ferredoxin oxidoreductase alpha subunit